MLMLFIVLNRVQNFLQAAGSSDPPTDFETPDVDSQHIELVRILLPSLVRPICILAADTFILQELYIPKEDDDDVKGGLVLPIENLSTDSDSSSESSDSDGDSDCIEHVESPKNLKRPAIKRPKIEVIEPTDPKSQETKGEGRKSE